jgi:phosphohistidine phosphatase
VKSLILVRHAESSTANSGQKDFERALTNTGIQDASRLGIYLANRKFIPDVILSSNARRAEQTAQLIAEQMGIGEMKLKYMEELYEASVRILMNVLEAIDPKIENVMIIGHNPSLTYLCEYLTGIEMERFEAAGACRVDLHHHSWDQLTKGNCRFIEYISRTQTHA